MKWIIFMIAVQSAYGKNLYPKDYSSIKHKELGQVITNSIFEELIEITKELKPPREIKPVSSVNQGRRGRLILEKIKKQNRERLAKMRGINPDEVQSGSDLVQKQKQNNKKLISEINQQIKSVEEWQKLAESEIAALRSQIISQWKLKHQEKIKRWEEKKKKYNQESDKYGQTTFNIPLVLPVDKEELEKKLAIKIKKDFFLVANALSLPIRDQKFRPTCSAFAGIRLIETLLAQHKKNKKLSEQYFYWASKENCQTQRCSQAGSWVGNGLKFSRARSREDIPLERDCPYQQFSQKGNETQIPLKRGCQKGYVQVGDYQYLKNLDQVIKTLNTNRTVIASVKLTPNFYSSKSLILYKDKNLGPAMDRHAQGHSVTIVGYVKLPQVLDEGKVCFIVANSWGEGWGQGGYACLSEKWVLNQRQVNPFVSLSFIKH